MSSLLPFPPHQPLGEQSFDVSDLVHAVSQSLERQCMRHGVDIDVDAPPHAIVAADREGLSRVLQKLLGRVIEATPAGGHVVVTTYSDHEQGVEIEVAGAPDESFEQFKSRAMQPKSDREEQEAEQRLLADVSRLVASSGIEICPTACPEGGMAFTLQVPRSSDQKGGSRKAA